MPAAYSHPVADPQRSAPDPDTGTQRLWPIFVGGFLGPFGGQVVTTMLPELAAAFDSDLAGVSAALTAYMVPFALLMIVSGTIAERIGRRRTVRLAYGLYAVSTLGCLLAPNLEVFLVARALQGTANAFITPVLAGAITEAVPPAKLGRSIGLLGSIQAAGQALAPLAGGAAAAWHWESAFVVVMISAIVLFFVPPPDSTMPAPASSAERWKALLNRQLLLSAVLAMLSFITGMALMLLTALFARDTVGVNATVAGLMVASFGIAGLLGGRGAGSLLDRFGRLQIGIIGFLLLGCGPIIVSLTAGLSPVTGAIVGACGLALSGVSSTAVRALTQMLALTSAPANRAGASSISQAAQFGGSAIAPFLFMPIYEAGHGVLALQLAAVPAGLGALILIVVLSVGRRTRS